jgi:hypothetical protein
MIVSAGPNQIIQFGSPAVIQATIENPSGTAYRFWRKISGPGVVQWAHEYWRTSHETGDFSEWEAPIDGFPKGAHEGGAFMSTEKSFSGRWAWKGVNDPALTEGTLAYSSKVSRWGFDDITAPGQAHYMSAYYWWPKTYNLVSPNSGPPIIMQWKARTSHNPVMPIFGKNNATNGLDYINLFDWTPPSAAHDNFGQDAVIPKDRWFNLTAYILAHQTAGKVMVWLDGKRIYHLTGENTLDAANNTSLRLYAGIANYGDNVQTRDPLNPLWVDDFSMVTDLADQLNTSVTFSEPGTYVFRLTATDDIETVSDDIRIEVQHPSPGRGWGRNP